MAGEETAGMTREEGVGRMQGGRREGWEHDVLQRGLNAGTFKKLEKTEFPY